MDKCEVEEELTRGGSDLEREAEEELARGGSDLEREAEAELARGGSELEREAEGELARGGSELEREAEEELALINSAPTSLSRRHFTSAGRHPAPFFDGIKVNVVGRL